MRRIGVFVLVVVVGAVVVAFALTRAQDKETRPPGFWMPHPPTDACEMYGDTHGLSRRDHDMDRPSVTSPVPAPGLPPYPC